MTKREKETLNHGLIAVIVFISCIGLYHYNRDEKPLAEISKEARVEQTLPSAPSQINVAPKNNFESQDKSQLLAYVDEVEFRIDQLNKCYVGECAMEEGDPRDDYFSIGQKVKTELSSLRNHVLANKITDEKISEIAREALNNEDGHVQEVALDILSSQEPSVENLDAILEKVIRGYDDKLIHQAMNELRRYPSQADQERIRTVLAEEMMHGTPFVAQAIAEKVGMFISSENLEFYQSLVNKIGPGTIVYNNLKASIDSFQSKASEG